MIRACLLAVAVFASPAAAQSIRSYGEDLVIGVRPYIRCAVILASVETVPGDVPIYRDEPVDFKWLSEEMFQLVRVTHGARLTRGLAAETLERLDGLSTGAEDQAVIVTALRDCLPHIERHLSAHVLNRAAPRSSLEEVLNGP